MNIILKKLSSLDIDLRGKKTSECFRMLHTLNSEYPSFNQWFYGNVIPAIQRKEKEIIIASTSEKIVGVAILKDFEEKKICTLRVDPMFQKNGIGKILIERSCDFLNTDKPLITVSNTKVPEFNKLFAYYGFKLQECYSDYYKCGTFEYAFNGELKKPFLLTQQFTA